MNDLEKKAKVMFYESEMNKTRIFQCRLRTTRRLTLSNMRQADFIEMLRDNYLINLEYEYIRR